MKVKLIPFRAEHLIRLRSRDADTIETLETSLAKEKWPAFTAQFDDEYVGAAGIMLQWPGVGSAWAIFTERLWVRPLWATRMVRQQLAHVIRYYDLHRVEMTVLAEHAKYRQWAEMLGFISEGIAQHYTADKRDVVRYVWLRDRTFIRQLRSNQELEFRDLLDECKSPLIGKSWEYFIDEHITMVAYHLDRMVGYSIHGFVPDGTAFGRDIGVHPKYRMRGLGQQLHQARLVACHRHGADYFVGITDDANLGMKKILENSGGVRATKTPQGITYVCELH